MKFYVFQASCFLPFPIRITAESFKDAIRIFHVWKNAYESLLHDPVFLKRSQQTLNRYSIKEN